MSDCLFCKIIGGEIPSAKVYEDETLYAFKDIAPQASVHVLIVPKAHIADAAAITPENAGVVAHIFEVLPVIAKQLDLEEGFRVSTNCGKHGCQSVQHLHFHLLGGEQLSEKMC